MNKIPTREEAYNLLKQYTKSDSLLHHALSVEIVMRHYAKLYNEDVELWGAVGLLHDLDYEMYPELHCKKTKEILNECGIEESFIRSILTHGYEKCTDEEPVHIMEKVLFTIDELTGLVTATALMRPSKSLLDLEYSSLWKKYKNPKFAAGVDRNHIEKGCQMLNEDLKNVIEQVITAMRGLETASVD